MARVYIEPYNKVFDETLALWRTYAAEYRGIVPEYKKLLAEKRRKSISPLNPIKRTELDEFPTISHKLAIKYLNKYFTFSPKQLIVGGHSKGGNLALVASMYANFLVRSKIKHIYSGDGPGVLDKEFKSNRYDKIRNKYTHIMPDYSLIGLFLRTSNNEVVKSKYKSVISHNAMFWEVEDDHFEKTELSPLSCEIQNELRDWFYRYNDEDKKEFISNLMKVLEDAGVTSILEIKEKNSKILNIIYETKDIKGNSKTILIDFINVMIKAITNTKKEEFKNFISNIFNFNKE